LFLLWWDEKELSTTGRWRYLLPIIMVFLSIMMVSEVKYPAFKSIDWRTRRTFTRMVVTIVVIGALVILRNSLMPVLLPLLFTAYLVYGFIRPRISRRMRHDIEEEDEEEAFEES
jgi:CDP-diacylglycerol---serine O-phosphatidyltransferase